MRARKAILSVLLCGLAFGQAVNPGRVNVVTTPWSVNWLTHANDAAALGDLGFSAWSQTRIGDASAAARLTALGFSAYSQTLPALADELAYKGALHLDHVVDVRDYGAAGDGVTDDTLAIQAAAQSITGRGVLYFPAGRYRIVHQGADFDPTGDGELNRTSYIHWQDVNDIAIVGDNAEILVNHDCTSASLTVFSFWGCENILLRGLHVNYATYGSPNLALNGYAMRCIVAAFRGDGTGRPAKNVRVENCRIRIKYTGPDSGAGNNCGQADNTHGKLIGLWFYGDYPGEPTVVTPSKCENFRVTNCDFYDCSARTVWCWYADDLWIAGNRFENTGSNLADIRVIVSCTNLTVLANRFVSNYANEAAATHILMDRQSGADSSVARILGNQFVTANNRGITCKGWSDVLIAGNRWRKRSTYASNSSYAVEVIDDSGATAVERLALVDNQLSQSRGLGIFQGQGVAVRGNSLDETEPISDAYGSIHIGTGVKAIVSDCVIRDSTQNGVMLMSPASVRGCYIDTCAQNGVYVHTAAADSIVEGNRILNCTLRGITHANYPANCIIANNRISACTTGTVRDCATWQVSGNILDAIVRAASHDYAAGVVQWTMTSSEAAADAFTVTNASGPASAVFPVAVPGKSFSVYNNSGAAITFKVTGQAGSAVANGKRAMFTMDTTDCREIYEQP